MLVYWPYGRKQHIFFNKNIFWKICILYIFIFFFYYFFIYGWAGCEPTYMGLGHQPTRWAGLAAQPIWSWARGPNNLMLGLGPFILKMGSTHFILGLGFSVQMGQKPIFPRAGLQSCGLKPTDIGLGFFRFGPGTKTRRGVNQFTPRAHAEDREW